MTIFQHRESRIFKDSRWFQPLSDPPSGKPLCRDADLKTMGSFLSDIFTTGQARNLFIYGKPSLLAEKAGKTKVETEDIETAIRSETKLELFQKLEAMKKKVEAMKKQNR